MDGIVKTRNAIRSGAYGYFFWRQVSEEPEVDVGIYGGQSTFTAIDLREAAEILITLAEALEAA